VDACLGNLSLADLARRKSYKWRTFPPDVLPAFVAEMDFAVAQPIAAAVQAAMAIGDTGYPHAGELGEAFAAFAGQRLGWQVKPERVFAIPDVMSGVAEILLAVTPHGSSVVINPPVYGPFFLRLALINRQIEEAPLRQFADGSYDLDFDVLDQALARPQVSSYLLCNPHNPVGQVWSRDQLLTIAELCERHQVELLVDEIHAPLVLPGAEHVAFASLDHPMAERAYTFNSASKGWNIAGLKCGVAVAGTQAAAELLTDRWESLLASHLGVIASAAAFTQAVDWLDAVRGQLIENGELLRQLLAEHLPEVGYLPPAASFLAWLDCRKLGLGDDPSGPFLDRGKVALTGGPYFGSQGNGFARLNIGTSPELISEAVRRMATAVRTS
jgi:cysteine-S-conjugate beta-lyase